MHWCYGAFWTCLAHCCSRIPVYLLTLLIIYVDRSFMFLFSQLCTLLLQIVFDCLSLNCVTFALIKRSILVLQQDNSACQVQQKGCKACFSNCTMEPSWLSRPPLFWDQRADHLVSILKCEVVVCKS